MQNDNYKSRYGENPGGWWTIKNIKNSEEARDTIIRVGDAVYTSVL